MEGAAFGGRDIEGALCARHRPPAVGQRARTNPVPGSIYFFEFRALIDAVAQAILEWVNSYNVDREKITKFVERYDETVSDGRLAIVKIGQ